ncbi:thioredoxin family protein (plasmid) [Arthrobacter sp. FW305-BF8]|uniref:thioredoxin family protein n=1 Tax=Arthrobacter sp. FW305-BF8 TaxID=2879617 RepID=UPI001F3AA551|nr:thioredoxin family protein [Arthrobacter sp. FW305-BF8]UKA56642.1 thioredoxin family protein [Arthrobacter sp. FW305-BF8]
MKIELLHITGCPNTARALAQIETALTALGRQDLTVHLRRIKSPADTAGTAFSGSPTITVDGTDIFPGAAPTTELACRIYPTPSGMAGVPTVDQVLEALRNRGL